MSALRSRKLRRLIRVLDRRIDLVLEGDRRDMEVREELELAFECRNRFSHDYSSIKFSSIPLPKSQFSTSSFSSGHFFDSPIKSSATSERRPLISIVSSFAL